LINWQNVGIQKELFAKARQVDDEDNEEDSDKEDEAEALSHYPTNCGEREEHLHFLQCNHEDYAKVKAEGDSLLRATLQLLLTAPSIQAIFMSAITAMLRKEEPDFTDFRPTSTFEANLQEAIDEQSNIETQYFMVKP
jgi:hypothetical protein